MIRRISIMIFLAMMPLTVAASFFGPNTFDECITESMQGVSSDQAARAIYKSCKGQFPENSHKGEKIRALSAQEMNAIIQDTSTVNSNKKSISGTLYNGNSDTTVTEVTISVMYPFAKKTIKRQYISKVSIPPLTVGSFSLNIFPVDESTAKSNSDPEKLSRESSNDFELLPLYDDDGVDLNLSHPYFVVGTWTIDSAKGF